MKMTILDYNQLQGLLRPSREQHLLTATNEIDLFIHDQHITTEFKSEKLLDMMEQLTADMSKVLDLPLATWLIEHPINKSWDLTCQCTRLVNLCRYNVVAWENYLKDNEPHTKPYGIYAWAEKLPEKH